MNSQREAFEKVFPVPEGIYWDSGSQQYEATDIKDSESVWESVRREELAEQWDGKLKVWQAAKAQAGEPIAHWQAGGYGIKFRDGVVHGDFYDGQPFYTYPPQPARAWRNSASGEFWPVIGEKYLICIGPDLTLQHEIYEFDQDDNDIGGGEYFWSRDDIDECPVFDVERDLWIALKDIQKILSAGFMPPMYVIDPELISAQDAFSWNPGSILTLRKSEASVNQQCLQSQVDPIYIEIAEERARQDVKWGGSAHDDEHAPFFWCQLIQDYAGWARVMAGMDNPAKYRRRMVQVATLAVAAAQSHDRLIARGQKEESSPEIPLNEESPVRDVKPGCHAGRDGECFWEGCPQIRDNEPESNGRHCPLDQGDTYL